MLMSVLTHHAVSFLTSTAQSLLQSVDLADPGFADDTLLMRLSQASLQEYLQVVRAAGNRFVLELHLGKLQLIKSNCDAGLEAGNGSLLHGMLAMSCLGTTPSSDGSVNDELTRRIGMCKADFQALTRVW